MNSLHIGGSEIRLTVNNDESRIIAFDPADVDFVERFYNLIADFERQQQDFTARAESLDAQTDVDSYGIPKNAHERIVLMREFCARMRELIDKVFGSGTSQKAFGNMNTLDMFIDFFEGVTPYMQQAREKKLAKYQKAANKA